MVGCKFLIIIITTISTSVEMIIFLKIFDRLFTNFTVLSLISKCFLTKMVTISCITYSSLTIISSTVYVNAYKLVWSSSVMISYSKHVYGFIFLNSFQLLSYFFCLFFRIFSSDVLSTLKARSSSIVSSCFFIFFSLLFSFDFFPSRFWEQG